jgi:hypothetical protein
LGLLVKKTAEKPLGSFCLLLPFRLAVARSYGTMIYIYSHQKLGRILLVIIDLSSQPNDTKPPNRIVFLFRMPAPAPFVLGTG